ncbi:deoxyuridine 5'-triphosphate nucleotidohydrolase [Sporolituus thermophilus]|uniref:dUTP diphosphatase n=1 Tax=Sporolituus thermophilus DSM 23256 TaxID=1123285 RepID=A0A1G7I0C3_9FIRM|nr:deoxyuridine 5'-triphosphate nucleotidohydrolase [Sporolituus thermophilus]SDF06247.1 dUTP pyrophosphatase [Sporolituus thermophilus DSM 23256]
MRQRGFEIVSSYIDKGIVLPRRQTAASAGYDFAAAEDVVAAPQTVTLIPTGLKAYMLPDEYLSIHIRSSLAVKHGLSLINGQGIIDADYYNNPTNEGHIILAVFNHGTQAVQIAKGTRIAQGIFNKYMLVDNDRIAGATRIGGIGSTGT